jgi:hypothetical protein
LEEVTAWWMQSLVEVDWLIVGDQQGLLDRWVRLHPIHTLNVIKISYNIYSK